MQKYYLITLAAFSANASAQTGILAKRSLLHRCYQQLTQTTLKPNDPLLAKIDAGQNPIDVCINDVLKSAYLADDSSGNIVIPNAKRAVGKQVMNTFHLLHSSWFNFKNVPSGSTFGGSDRQMYSIFEPNAAALYFTATLLDPTKNADYFLTTSDYLRSLRDNGPATSTAFPVYLNATQAAAFANFQGSGVNVMYQSGIPFGIRTLPSSERTFTTVSQDNYPRQVPYSQTALKLFQQYGGGFIGLDVYMARTFDEVNGTFSDGVIEVPRKWSENIFKDVMCLNLPVVRQVDAEQFVDPASNGEFRRTVGCTTCHASMDRMAGVIKSFGFSEQRTQGTWTTWVNESLWNKGDGADYSWSSNYRSTYKSGGMDMSNYLKEDHVGFLYYRGYDGRLVSQKVDSPTALGKKMSQQIEPYLCAAKRYYRFFTGVDVDFTDPGDKPLPLRPQDAVHYNFILEITKALVNADSSGQLHPKNMSSLIEAILRSPQYQLSDFGAPQ